MIPLTVEILLNNSPFKPNPKQTKEFTRVSKRLVRQLCKHALQASKDEEIKVSSKLKISYHSKYSPVRTKNVDVYISFTKPKCSRKRKIKVTWNLSDLSVLSFHDFPEYFHCFEVVVESFGLY